MPGFVRDLPLIGLRVLDLCEDKGALIGRLLADLGAEVLMVEPPQGAALRRSAPRLAGVSLRHLAHNAGKASVVLDLSTEAGRAQLWQLLGTADVVVEDRAPGELAELGLGPATLREQLPGLVVVSVSDFGQTGPYRDWAATDEVHLALGGVLARSGLPGLPPLLPPGRLATWTAATQAAFATLAALTRRRDTGVGDHVDVSLLEATALALDPGFGVGGTASLGRPASEGPPGRPDARHLYPIFRCADGLVRLCILAPRQWQGMFRWLGEPAALADPEFAATAARFAARDRIYPLIGELLSGLSRDEAVEQGQAFGVPTAAVRAGSEIRDSPQFAARGAFRTVPVGSGEVRLADGFVELDGSRAGLAGPAPALGQHEGWPSGARSARPRPRGGEPARRPLDGLRVLDLGVIVVGAESGRLLADLGAEVIKVENRGFLDGTRQPDPDGMTATVGWGHRNKLSLGLDLRSPRGLELFCQLASCSDVVLSNFKPGTLEALGLGPDVLLRLNPRLVVVDSSAFGPTGPWSSRMGYGPLVRAETGISQQWRYPDVEDGFSDASTVYPDHVAARLAVTVVLARLLRRRETGRGGCVSIAQAETILGQFAAEIAAADAGVSPPPRHSVVLPAAGEDEWVVVSARDPDDLSALAALLGSTIDGTWEGLLPALADWVRGRPGAEAMAVLQGKRVPCGRMNRLSDFATDPHLIARGLLRQLSHPQLPAALPAERVPAHWGIADPPDRPAPRFGEHTRQIAAEVLGLGPDEVESLVSEGILQEAGGVVQVTSAEVRVHTSSGAAGPD